MTEGRCRSASAVFQFDLLEAPLIRFMGTKKTDGGSTRYVFLINGQQKEIKEDDLKLYPGCLDKLPQSVKAKIEQNRKWKSSF